MKLFERFLCFSFYFFANLLRKSYRYKYTGLENFEEAKKMAHGGAHIVASWHQNAIGGVLGKVGHPYNFLISASRDGEYVNYISEKFQFGTVRGSSRKNGAKSKEILGHALKGGKWVAITVDGPTGPAHKVKRGIIDLSSSEQVPILPVTVAVDRKFIFKKTWDQTVFPLPFSRIIFRYGRPIQIPPNQEKSTISEHSDYVAKELNKTYDQAELNLAEWKSH